MHLRNLAFKLRMVTTHLDRPATGLEIRLAMIEEPLNLWAWQQLHAIRNFDTYSETPWFNTFQHKFFIFSSITTYYARLPSAFLDGCLRHSYSQWVDHLQTVVSKTNPEVSRAFLKLFPSHLEGTFPDGRPLEL